MHATNPESLNMALRGISSSKGITEPGKSVHHPGGPKPAAAKPPANGGDGAAHGAPHGPRRPVPAGEDVNPLDQ